MLPVVFAFILYLIWRAPGRLQRLQEVIPQERAARVGFVIAAVLGFALNDSGIAVPGLMLGRDERLARLPRPPHRGPPLEGRDRRPRPEPEPVGAARPRAARTDNEAPMGRAIGPMVVGGGQIPRSVTTMSVLGPLLCC